MLAHRSRRWTNIKPTIIHDDIYNIIVHKLCALLQATIIVQRRGRGWANVGTSLARQTGHVKPMLFQRWATLTTLTQRLALGELG